MKSFKKFLTEKGRKEEEKEAKKLSQYLGRPYHEILKEARAHEASLLRMVPFKDR